MLSLKAGIKTWACTYVEMAQMEHERLEKSNKQFFTIHSALVLGRAARRRAAARPVPARRALAVGAGAGLSRTPYQYN